MKLKKFEVEVLHTSFWGYFEPFWGITCYFGLSSKTVLGSTHIVEQLSFSMLCSILTVDFGKPFAYFSTFWGPNGLFLSQGRVRKLFFGFLI